MRPRDPKYWSQSFWDLLKNLLRRKQFDVIAEAAHYRSALEKVQKSLDEDEGDALASAISRFIEITLREGGDAGVTLNRFITELRDLVDEKKVDVAAAMINELDKTEDDRFKLESISRRFGLRAR